MKQRSRNRGPNMSVIQKDYIRSNCSTVTMLEIAAHLNLPYINVFKFIDREGLAGVTKRKLQRINTQSETMFNVDCCIDTWLI